MGVKDPLRKMSLDNWRKYGRGRYRIEGVFGSIKQKLGSSFRVVREDISMKMALACALLWNLYMLVVWIYFFVLLSDLVKASKKTWRVKGSLIFETAPVQTT